MEDQNRSENSWSGCSIYVRQIRAISQTQHKEMVSTPSHGFPVNFASGHNELNS